MGDPLATIRASSWAALFDCPHRWYWQHIVGLKMPTTGALALGTAVHAGTAAYDKATLAKSPIDVATACDESRKSLHDEKLNGAVFDDVLTPMAADNLAVNLTISYCNQIAPRQKYVAVEAQCDALDIGTEYGTIRVTGTTDRVRETEDGRLGIADLKTGKRATEYVDASKKARRAVTSGHQFQLGIYTLMAEQSLGVPLEAPAQIVGLQTSKETHVAVGEIGDVKTPLIGNDEQPGVVIYAAQMLKSGLFPPNPKSMCCSEKYCVARANGKCIYHD